MRTIGLDLAVQTAHKAVVLDEGGHFCTPIMAVHTQPRDLDHLLARAREGAPAAEVQIVMEPTGMAWFPVAVYYARQALPIFLVNSQEVADLRRHYKRHAKSDRIDARVLARLPLVNPDKLHRLMLPSATALACQRACYALSTGSPPRSRPSRTGCRRLIALPGPGWKKRSSPIRLRLRPASSASTATIPGRCCGLVRTPFANSGGPARWMAVM